MLSREIVNMEKFANFCIERVKLQLVNSLGGENVITGTNADIPIILVKIEGKKRREEATMDTGDTNTNITVINPMTARIMEILNTLGVHIKGIPNTEEQTTMEAR